VPNPLSAIDPLGLATCPVIKQRVLDNVAASKAAREASNFPKRPVPPGQGYHNETYASRPIKPENAISRWDDFLGPGPHTNTHPRTGLLMRIG